jgi:hypothetical protein
MSQSSTVLSARHRAAAKLLERMRDQMRAIPEGVADPADYEIWGREFAHSIVSG